MDPLKRRPLGSTGVEVTQLGFGGGTLGDRVAVIPESQAEATIEAAWEAGIRYFDTSPWYGKGKSEHRLGRVLRTRPRGEFTLSTKVGRVFFPAPFPADDPAPWTGGLPFDWRVDYTRDGVLRSYEDSLQRLGMNRIDAILIHDLDRRHLQTEAGVAARLAELDEGGGFEALDALRRSGEIGAIGAGLNETGMIPRFLQRFAVDFFILAMPYTLLDQEGLEVDLEQCRERGASVVIGAPFSSGILAAGAAAGGTYRYQPPPAPVLAKMERIEAACRRHGVPVGAAALQFPLGHPAVVSVIPGPNTVRQAQTNVEWMRTPVPADLWRELKQEGLVHPDAPTPAGGTA